MMNRYEHIESGQTVELVDSEVWFIERDDLDSNEYVLLKDNAGKKLVMDKLKFEDNFEKIEFDSYKQLASELGSLVDTKNKAYGNSFNKTAEMIKLFLQDYQNEDGTFTIPECMVEVISRQTRFIDKQSRIFNNPSGDLMDESPYSDMAGYSLLGMMSDME